MADLIVFLSDLCVSPHNRPDRSRSRRALVFQAGRGQHHRWLITQDEFKWPLEEKGQDTRRFQVYLAVRILDGSFDRRKLLKWTRMKFSLEKDKLLILLVLTDVCLIFLHMVHTYTSLASSSLFSIEDDRGYGELFQYIKEMWIATLLFFLGTKKSTFLYCSFSLLFLYFLLDDSLMIHERLGLFLAEFVGFEPKFGLRSRDFGELIVSGCFGALFFIFIGIAHYCSDAATRIVSKYLIAMILLLAFFGVLIDMLNIMLVKHAVNPILGIMEDGGEMLVMSIITWFVFRLNPTNEEIPFFGKPNAR